MRTSSPSALLAKSAMVSISALSSGRKSRIKSRSSRTLLPAGRGPRPQRKAFPFVLSTTRLVRRTILHEVVITENRASSGRFVLMCEAENEEIVHRPRVRGHRGGPGRVRQLGQERAPLRPLCAAPLCGFAPLRHPPPGFGACGGFSASGGL